MSNVGSYHPSEHYASGVGSTWYVSHTTQPSDGTAYVAYEAGGHILTDNETTFTYDLETMAFANNKGSTRWFRVYGPMANTNYGGVYTTVKVPSKEGRNITINPGVWRYQVTKGHSAQTIVGYWRVDVCADSACTDKRNTWTFAVYSNVDTKTSYTVAYSANGGSSTPGSQTKWYNESLTLQGSISHGNTSPGSYTVTLNGNGATNPSALTSNRTTTYSFRKWKASNGTEYSAKAAYTANAGTTMTAQWNTSETRANVTLPNITRTNYTFNGWYTASSGGSWIGGSGSTYNPSGNVTFYAQWTQIYASPKILDVKLTRCDPDGRENNEGSALSVRCTGRIYKTSASNTVWSFTCSVNGHTGSATMGAFSDSSEWREFEASFLVPAELDPDEIYAAELLLTDTQGGTSGRSSASVRHPFTVPSAYYTVDFLGDKYQYEHTEDYLIDSAKTYYRLQDGEYVESDPSDYTNLMRAWSRTTTDQYLAYSIPLDEWLAAEQTYTLQLWDVDVSHSGKSASDTGVVIYYCGGSVRLGGWYGAYFTNGHADHLVMTFTPHASSGATTSTASSHAYAGGDQNLSHGSVTGAVNPFLNIYNSVPSVNGTMNLTIGSWKLEKGSTATEWSPAFLDADEDVEGDINLLGGNALKPTTWTKAKPAVTSVLEKGGPYETVVAFYKTEGGWETIDSPAIEVTKGVQYKLSFDYSVDKDFTSNTGDGYFGVQVCSAAINGQGKSSSYSTIYGYFAFPAVKTERTRGSITFTPTTSPIYLVLNGGNIDDGQTSLSFWLGHLKLEVANGSNGTWHEPTSLYELSGPRAGRGVAFGGPAKSEGLHIYSSNTDYNAVTGLPGDGEGAVNVHSKLLDTGMPYDQHVPQANTYHRIFVIKDVNERVFGGLTAIRSTNGHNGVYIEAHNISPSGTNAYASLQVMVYDDGSKQLHSDVTPKILWSGASYMNASQTITLSQAVSKQFTGIVLAWSSYANNAAENANWTFTYIPKTWVASHGSAGVYTVCQSIQFKPCIKYVYVYDTQVKGYSGNGSSGTAYNVQYDNARFVLRYVYGV